MEGPYHGTTFIIIRHKTTKAKSIAPLPSNTILRKCYLHSIHRTFVNTRLGSLQTRLDEIKRVPD